MSSTTTNLGLVKMASGETIGQWSDANNGSGANLDKIDTAIGNLNSHIAVLPSYTQCSNRSALETHLASVTSGMTDNQIQTVYIVTGATFGFDVFGSGERYAGELKRMTSTQFVCRLASRLGDSIDIGYYEGTYAYNKLLTRIYKKTITGTTSATGAIDSQINVDNYYIVSAAFVRGGGTAGFAFWRGNDGYLRCFDINMQPLANAAVSIDIIYCKRSEVGTE